MHHPGHEHESDPCSWPFDKDLLGHPGWAPGRDGREPYAKPPGYQMINSILIENFRCFPHLKIDGCRRFNVIVGDNGAGKTSLLEAIFLTLSGNIEVSTRLRAHRGLDALYNGAPAAIEESIWRDYFYNLDWSKPIAIRMSGSGPEARSLTISRGQSNLLIPIGEGGLGEPSVSAPLTFTWRDANGIEYSTSPRVSTQGIQITGTQEFPPHSFMFAANQPTSAGENAARFSALSKARRERPLVKLFSKEFPWIQDLSIEVSGGIPIIHATIENIPEKLPINMVSGGINRVLAILLAMAAYPGTVVVVDEIENGLYHKHKVSYWRSLLLMARDSRCQLFTSTHDEEWLEALVEAAGDSIEDVTLWRVERSRTGERALTQIDGRTLKAGIEIGGEVR